MPQAGTYDVKHVSRYIIYVTRLWHLLRLRRPYHCHRPESDNGIRMPNPTGGTSPLLIIPAHPGEAGSRKSVGELEALGKEMEASRDEEEEAEGDGPDPVAPGVVLVAKASPGVGR